MKTYEKPEMEVVTIIGCMLTSSCEGGTGCDTQGSPICAWGHDPAPGCDNDYILSE